ncbi:MAG: tetratricopeptide repeat protein, partial [Gloeomargaritaceae cyanobacterium C42_A2020_066]|nr:tetratricopeptide repeat protein [Gloeomargaritaceae cyanobacterium C42_A2020_066]
TNPDPLPDLYLLRSLILYHQGQDQQSQDDIARALDRNPRLGSAYRLLGLLYARQERYQDALAALNRAIDLEPASGEAYFGRGMIHLRLDQRQEAVRDWQQAEKLLTPRAAFDPDMAQTLNQLRQQISRYSAPP